MMDFLHPNRPARGGSSSISVSMLSIGLVLDTAHEFHCSLKEDLIFYYNLSTLQKLLICNLNNQLE